MTRKVDSEENIKNQLFKFQIHLFWFQGSFFLCPSYVTLAAISLTQRQNTVEAKHTRTSGFLFSICALKQTAIDLIYEMISVNRIKSLCYSQIQH